MAKKPARKLKRIIIWVVSLLLAFLVVLPSIGTVIVYECIFGMRYETENWRKFTEADYEGLRMERSDFLSGKETLAGYKYSRDDMQPKGVVVIAHGLGSGGHNTFMPYIDAFTANGYYVFSYDAHGNGESGGRNVRGLPQGLIDLDMAISHAETIEEYADLPVMLMGHSWGAYSCANVLDMHPEVAAAVIISGFNESENMLLHYGTQYAGPAGGTIMPYLQLYERIKFGAEYTDLTAVEAMAGTDANIMIIHSTDDETVPFEYGYGAFYEAFYDSERFEFVKYEDRGHDNPFCSDESEAYRDEVNMAYAAFINENEADYSEDELNAFMEENLDKKRAYEPDAVLLKRILNMYDSCALQEG